MGETAVGFSGSYVRKDCEKCSQNKMEIVQTQNYLINLGKLHIFGLGSRGFGLKCQNCDMLFEMAENQEKKAMKLKFSILESDRLDTLLKVGGKSNNRRYPVLKTERRKKIIASNRKEGTLSLIIGLVIGFFVLTLPYRPWTLYIGGIIIVYSIVGGLYGMFEDPERKHREYIDHNVKI